MSTLPTRGHAQDAMTEWKEKWDNSLAYTLEALELVPDDSLGYQPTGGQMTLHAQIRHSAGNVYGLSSRYLGYQPDSYDREAVRIRLQDETLDKAGLTALLTDAYAFGADAVASLDAEAMNEEVDFFAGPKTRRQIAYLLQDHATHHRAQVLVYLRLLGLTPPRYRGW